MCFMMNTLHLLSPSNLKNRICKYKQNNLIYNLYLEKKVVSPEKNMYLCIVEIVIGYIPVFSKQLTN